MFAVAVWIFLVAAVRPAAAQNGSGTAAVNDKTGNGVTISLAGTTKPTATGINAAGDKVFNGVAQSYKVGDKLVNGDRLATPTEEAKLKDLISAAQLLITTANKLNAAQQTAAAAAFAATAVAKMLPANGDFAQVPKAGLVLGAGPVKDANAGLGGGVESATAKAREDATNAKALSTAGTTASVTATAGKGIPNPMAVAFAANIDPSAVTWDSLSSRAITLDLSHVTLTATSTLGGAAASTLGLQGSFNNTTDDVTTPQSSSTALFNMNLGLFSFDNLSPSPITNLTFLGFSMMNDPGNLNISDNLGPGHTGLTTVATDLMTNFVPLGGGTYGFSAPFSITMNVPGTSADTLLYLNDAEGVAAAAVPEPGAMALFAVMASFGAASYAWRRRRAA
jgi:hypothetical protein